MASALPSLTITSDSNDLEQSYLPTPPLSATYLTPSPTVPHGEDERACNLEVAKENSDDIIKALSRTAASPLERDKWMIAAGQFRRKGETEAVITTIETMIQGIAAPWSLREYVSDRGDPSHDIARRWARGR